LGLRSLIEKRALIDCFNKKLIFIGPGGYKLACSPGTRTFDLKQSPSGHLLLPVTCWRKGTERRSALATISENESEWLKVRTTGKEEGAVSQNAELAEQLRDAGYLPAQL
jgi:hypothetical protein